MPRHAACDGVNGELHIHAALGELVEKLAHFVLRLGDGHPIARDDDHRLCGCIALCVAEHGAAQQRNADRLEVVAVHYREICLRKLFRRYFAAANLKWHLKGLVAAERDVAGQRDGLHARL